ncbi:MAG: 16S rRNA (adenine(1518)-N(6)/adenine(1519)-N(6))-dimethyltransferase RsmA, partial [Candidatus Paceibacterota bacterium]
MQTKNSFKNKKSLGQNFINSPKIIEKIINPAEITPADTVLEIGPGTGTMTSMILERARKVVTIEKDDRLIPILKEKFEREVLNKKLEIVHGDFLEVDLDKNGLKEGEFKVVANIPYYITGQIVRRLLENHPRPKMIVLTVQKEVAERIVAKDGKESLLSLSVKAFGQPKYIETIRRGNFTPIPNVDSAVLLISD